VPPSQLAPQPIPADLDEIILACLQKDPMNRPQSADEIADALGRVYLANPWTRGRARRWWLANPPSRRHPAEPTQPPPASIPETETKILAPSR
jgi:serine/threonine protein kinase